MHLVLNSFLNHCDRLGHIIGPLTTVTIQAVLSVALKGANRLRGGHVPASDPPCLSSLRSGVEDGFSALQQMEDEEEGSPSLHLPLV